MAISVHRAQDRACRRIYRDGRDSIRHGFGSAATCLQLIFFWAFSSSVYIIVRQIRSRPVRSFNPRVPLILGVIGVVELVSFVKTDHDKVALVATLAGSLVLAAVMGADPGQHGAHLVRRGRGLVAGNLDHRRAVGGVAGRAPGL